MKIHGLLGFLSVLLAACWFGDSKDSADTPLGTTTASNADYPFVIDGGKRIVYQFAKMTPRGLRYFVDTVAYHEDPERFTALNPNYLFPLDLTDHERNNAPGIIAFSLPGYFEETVFGLIDDKHQLIIRYKDVQMALTPKGPIPFKNPDFLASFQNDSIKAELKVKLEDTKTGAHRAGKGQLVLFEDNILAKQFEIFLVAN
jgi:hypothetical protein